MAFYRVYELAKEFDTESKIILKILANNNCPVLNHMSKVGPKEKSIIEETISNKELFNKIIESITIVPDNDPNLITKLRRLTIHKFRCFIPSTQIELNDYLTLIVGQNATSKSTLLGMICQPFEFEAKYKVYTNVYDALNKSKTKTILGTSFESDLSDVFRMSPQNDDPRKEKYTYDIELSVGNHNFTLPVTSEYRTDQKNNNIRFVTGKTRNGGEGNYPHPVIYLGLNRLYPLANSENVRLNESFNLSDEEKIFYSNWQQKITLVSEKIMPEFIASDTKNFLGCKAELYDAEANSAGQDNLGQIISAVLSFKRLKDSLGDFYRGGILLIDELDATFHILAQEKLIDFLIYAAKHFSLQIICTTHSLTMIELCSHQYKKESSVISIYRRNNNIHIKNNPSFEDIRAELNAKREIKSIPLTTILFEDTVACTFFKHITHHKFSKLITTYSSEAKNDETCLSGDVYLKLASKKIPDFDNIVFVIDGDKSNEITRKHNHIVALPGKFALEEEMYYFLYNLPEDDIFWSAELGGYNHQTCFRDFPIPQTGKDKIKFFKNWFDSQKFNWGTSNRLLYNRWIYFNKDSVKDFINNFFTIYNKTAKLKCSDNIKESIFSWIDEL